MDYKDYITDFSSRAKKVLEKFSECDRDNELNVTALLSVAMSAFVIPFERLKESHPSGDEKKFEKIADELKKALDCGFKDSRLFSNAFKIKTLNKNEFSNTDFHGGFEAVNPAKKVNCIVDIIRNSLAHGNIYTDLRNDTQHIDTLYFVSKKSNEKKAFHEALEKYKESGRISKTAKDKIYNEFINNRNSTDIFVAIECSVDDFKSFVYEWINLLANSEK